MELIDGVFHQLSEESALVAIMADYTGLIQTPQVPKTKVLVPRTGIRPRVFNFLIATELCRGGF